MFRRIPGFSVLLNLMIVGFYGSSAVASASQQHAQPDITHYDLAIRPDFKLGRIRIQATLRIENPARDSTFWFALGSRYMAQVRRGGQPLAATHEGSRLSVTVPQPRKVETLTFEIEADKPRSEDEDRSVVGAHDLFLLWSDKFYPMSYEDWATVRTTMFLPAGFQAVAPGRLLQTNRTAMGVTYVFETTRPTRLFSVFADDRWTVSERRVGGITIRTLLHPTAGRFRDRIFRSSGDVLGYYRELFGTYDFEGFSFVTLDSMYARRAFPGFIGYSPEYLEKEMTRTGHDAHETALLWWGYTLGGTGPGSFQWTEGFGDYAEVLYDESRRLPLSHNLTRARDDYLAALDGDVPYTELRGSTPQKYVHGKLPWLLHVIRFVSGDTAFRRAMRLLFERYEHRTLTMDELIATLEEGLRAKLSWWRTEWLGRKGVPNLHAAASVDSTGSGYRLECRITQIGNIYHIPVEIGIDTERGRRLERVALSDSVQVWRFAFRERPVRVALDPNHWLLARLPREPLIGSTP